MTITPIHSPGPWTYEYSPYTLQTTFTHEKSGTGNELAAFEVFDAEGNKLFDSNEDLPPEIQEATIRLATAAPALLEALENLADQADEDCPEEYRSHHFREALQLARDLIAQRKFFDGSPPRSEIASTMEAE